MSLLLAPYNDSMRLGQGYNSYTQTICTERAVKYPDRKPETQDPSQVVSYSSKFVERLSDVVKTMNISYSSAIKKGTVELAGNANHIDEDKIKQADTNLLVSVKVVNQTSLEDEECLFQPLKGIEPNTTAFNDAFGDCYISGFIHGGDFSGIVSMRVLDRSNTAKVTSAVKRSIKTGSTDDFTLDMDTFTSGMANSDALNDTETTISVAWSGGGQVKAADTDWNVASVFAAAAAFPSQVAKCPQKTWAILTKYKANRSFVEYAAGKRVSVLEYDSVASFTAELFDNFMEYKQLLKLVQDIISDPTLYKASWKPNAIPNETRTLVAVRTALRVEMAKIVKVVDILARDPSQLGRIMGSQEIPTNSSVRAIVEDALGVRSTRSAPKAPVVPSNSGSATTAPAHAESFNTSPVLVSHEDPSAPATTTSATPLGGPESLPANDNLKPAVPSGPSDQAEIVTYESVDWEGMIAPEIWTDVLPILKITDDTNSITKGVDGLTLGQVMAEFPKAPTTDGTAPDATAPPVHPLTILAGSCGTVVVTDKLQKLVTNNGLTFRASILKSLVENTSHKLDPYQPLVLSFICQYGSDDLRLVVAKEEASAGATDTTRQFIITEKLNEHSSDYVKVTPSDWNSDTWSITALAYGGNRPYTDIAVLNTVAEQIKSNYAMHGSRYLEVGNPLISLIGDPWPNVRKTATLFYQITAGGQMQMAIGVDERVSLVMTDKRSPDLTNPQSRALCSAPPYSMAKPTRQQIMYSRSDTWVIGPSREPFFEFANGTKFYFLPSGTILIRTGEDRIVFQFTDPLPNPPTDGYRALSWQPDGNFCAYRTGACYFATMTQDNDWQTSLVFSDQAPYMQIGSYMNIKDTVDGGITGNASSTFRTSLSFWSLATRWTEDLARQIRDD